MYLPVGTSREGSHKPRSVPSVNLPYPLVHPDYVSRLLCFHWFRVTDEGFSSVRPPPVSVHWSFMSHCLRNYFHTHGTRPFLVPSLTVDRDLMVGGRSSHRCTCLDLLDPHENIVPVPSGILPPVRTFPED